MKYKYHVGIKSVNAVIQKVNWRKDEQGQTIHDVVATGVWAVHLSDRSIVYLPEQPVGFEVGKIATISVEVHDDGKIAAHEVPTKDA